tara:strand:- start:203 stop:490 length:288 start_codon:yes stop_codon:yes gene_type:complete
MLSKNEEMKAALLCVVALLVGLFCVVLTGCDRLIESQHEPHFDIVIPPSKYEMHDLTYPSNEYDIDKMATLKIKCCEGCGFVPWTDSWCEFHFGT